MSHIGLEVAGLAVRVMNNSSSLKKPILVKEKDHIDNYEAVQKVNAKGIFWPKNVNESMRLVQTIKYVLMK